MSYINICKELMIICWFGDRSLTDYELDNYFEKLSPVEEQELTVWCNNYVKENNIR